MRSSWIASTPFWYFDPYSLVFVPPEKNGSPDLGARSLEDGTVGNPFFDKRLPRALSPKSKSPNCLFLGWFSIRLLIDVSLYGTTDTSLEGPHFTRDYTPEEIGYKALATNLSDIAAMGGRPHHAMVTLILNPNSKLSYLKSIYRGLSKAAALHGISIVGGETASAGKNSKNSITISLTGTVKKNQCCFRNKGKPGHKLYVTGKLGGSIKGKHLKFKPRIQEARWLASKYTPSAMMDLSDGLANDLPKLAKASHCGYDIDLKSIPRSRGSSIKEAITCLLYTSPSPRDVEESRMPASA